MIRQVLAFWKDSKWCDVTFLNQVSAHLIDLGPFCSFLDGHTSVLASTNSILNFFLTSIKLDDFRYFMRSSPDCSNIGSNCVFIYLLSFAPKIGFSKLSFSSHLPASAHHLLIPDFHFPLFPGVLFIIHRYIRHIKPRQWVFDFGFGYKINIEVTSKISCVYESRGRSSDFWLPTSDFQLPTSDFRLLTSDFRLLISHFPLPTSHFRLPISHFWFPTSDSPVP